MYDTKLRFFSFLEKVLFELVYKKNICEIVFIETLRNIFEWYSCATSILEYSIKKPFLYLNTIRNSIFNIDEQTEELIFILSKFYFV